MPRSIVTTYCLSPAREIAQEQERAQEREIASEKEIAKETVGSGDVFLLCQIVFVFITFLKVAQSFSLWKKFCI